MREPLNFARLTPDVYFTDGTSLYRAVRIRVTGSGVSLKRIVLAEDCAFPPEAAYDPDRALVPFRAQDFPATLGRRWEVLVSLDPTQPEAAPVAA